MYNSSYNIKITAKRANLKKSLKYIFTFKTFFIHILTFNGFYFVYILNHTLTVVVQFL